MANEIVSEIRLELDKLRADLKEAQKAGEDSAGKIGKGVGDGIEAGIGKAVGGLKSTIFALGSALAGAFAVKEVVAAASEQQNAINGLNSAMYLAGTYSAKASAAFQDYASQLQKTTSAQDDAIERGGALLISLGKLRDDGLNRATKAALDLAAGLSGSGMTVESAFNLVAKASAGNVGALSRYGIQIKDTGDNAKDFANALAAIESRFKGMAELQANTFSGAMTKTKNQFGEVMESLGNIIIQSPTVIAILKLLAKSFESLANWISNFAKNRDLINELGMTLVKVGTVLNTYLLAPLELAFNILKTGALAIATAFTGLIQIFNLVGQAITEYLIKPVVDFLGGALGKLISLVDKDLGDSVAAYVQRATTDVQAGFATIAAEAGKVTQELAAQTSVAAGSVLDFDVATKSQEYIGKIGEFFATVTPPLQAQVASVKETIAASMAPSAFDSFLAGFINAKNQFIATYTNIAKVMSELGKQIFTTLGMGTANAFSAMGAAMVKGENGMAAFGKAMLGVLGDIALQFGSTFILMGVAKTLLMDPTGPLLIAAGAALSVLGGALKAFAGGGGAAAPATAASAGGGVAAAGGTGEAPVTNQGQQLVDEPERKQIGTSVVVNVQGNVLDRRQTGLELAEVINEAFGSNGVTFATGNV